MRSIIFVAVFLALTPFSVACSCGGGGGPACEEAWSKYTSAVFLGKVVSVHADVMSYLGAALDMNSTGPLNRVEFEIEESFLGVSGKKVTVRTASSGPACGYTFVEGERYVVYAASHANQLFVSMCSHTRPAKFAEEDLAYLRSLPSLPPTATIQGSLWRYTHDPNFKPKFEPSIMDHYRPPEQVYTAMAPVPGVTIVAQGENNAEVSTEVNADGSWKISGLTPGSYTVSPRLDENIFVHFYRGKVTVVPKGCAQVDLRVENNGRIVGELTHDLPQKDWVVLKLFAVPVSNPDLRHPTLQKYIEQNQSSFEIAPLPAGKYIIGVYLSKQVQVGNGAHTYKDTAPTYYPGVPDLESATVIEVHEGEKLSGFNFRMLNTGFLPDGWRCEVCDKKQK